VRADTVGMLDGIEQVCGRCHCLPPHVMLLGAGDALHAWRELGPLEEPVMELEMRGTCQPTCRDNDPMLFHASF
jgi:hypothetical protein